MSTVGYGDVSTTSNLERVFVIILMVAGVIMFSYASGALASILTTSDEKEIVVQKRLKVLQSVSYQCKFSTQLVNLLKQELAYNTNANNNDEDQLKKLLHGLPHRLRQRVMNEIYADMEQEFPLF